MRHVAISWNLRLVGFQIAKCHFLTIYLNYQLERLFKQHIDSKNETNFDWNWLEAGALLLKNIYRVPD